MQNDKFILNGFGDIGNNFDSFQFVYRRLSGDGELIARLNDLEAGDGNTKAGLMIRKDSTSGSKHAALIITGNDNTFFYNRKEANATSEVMTANDDLTVPKWLRITRIDSTITASTSLDQKEWTAIGSVDLQMNEDVLIGMCSSSHNSSSAAKSEFAGVELKAGSAHTAPQTPSSFSIAPRSFSELKLTWKDCQYEDGYILERGDVSHLAVIDTLSADTIQYVDSGLTASTTYFYKLTAYNSNGKSPAAISSGRTKDTKKPFGDVA